MGDAMVYEVIWIDEQGTSQSPGMGGDRDARFATEAEARAAVESLRTDPEWHDADLRVVEIDPPYALRLVIRASGLSARQWAVTVALRDERTVRRWLAGDSPIPDPVIRYLHEQLAR